ncbi:MAG: hypothetical protein M3459_01085 [Actinomycetota bacterium]|nr:hypothetical protein [Actinomycetota bacterium]
MLGAPASVWIALGLAVALAALHLAAPRLRRLPGVPESALGSFAGGISIAYVFVHLLPELAEGNEEIAEALEETVESTALLDLAIFAVALAGFSVFYGLERLARRAGEREPGALFGVHLGAFALYNVLITYTMPLRVRTGLDFALLFTVAMGLHYVLTDRGMLEHYPSRFRAWGRYLLAAGLLLGWLLGALAAPTNTLVVSLLTAALGGSIMLNVFKEELPSDRASSFGWFLIGVLLYAGLLALVTALGG